MHALIRLPVAMILTDRIVDDGGLFPPEELDMAYALVRHRRDQVISKPVLPQLFLCTAGRFDELHQQLDDGDRIRVIALGPVAPQMQAHVVSLQVDDRTPVMETSLPVDNQDKEQALEVIDQIAAARPHLNIFVEVGLGPDLLQRHGDAAKVRCGGREVPFKATAGLNHATSHPDGYRGFDHFGLLKGLTTHDAGEIRATFHSVGNCSTSEPIDDPRRLGLIADPV